MMSKIINPEKFFVLFAVIFGFLFLIIIPPFQSPDDGTHLYRAYGISENQFVPSVQNNMSGSESPKAISEFAQKFGYMCFDKKAKITVKEIIKSADIKIGSQTFFADYPNTTLYSPAAYLPQTLGIKFAKTFTNSVFWIMLFGRIFNLLFYIILGYYAVKTTPFLKWLMLTILLFPMGLSLASSLSSDAVLISTSALFIAKVFQCAFKEDKSVKNIDIFILSLLAIIIALTKQSFLLVLFVFLIPKNKYEKHYLLKLASVILPAFLSAIVWAKTSAHVYIPQHNSNPMAQMEFIIHHPFTYAYIFIKTYVIRFIPLLNQSIGVLGWLNIRFDVLYPYFIFLVISYSLYAYESLKNTIKAYKSTIALLAGISIFYIITVSTMIYLSWSYPGQNKIEGLQGRYFIPVLFPLLSIIALKVKPKTLPVKFYYINCAILFFVYIGILIRLILRFYTV